MKLRIASSAFLFASTTLVYANPTPINVIPVLAPGKLYVGVFGGAGSSNHVKVSQYGTAFYTEANGGPLAVNAFGQLKRHTPSFFGVQLGYQAHEIPLCYSQWTLGPAAELEGYYMNKSSFSGELFNNTARLPEHDFIISYPMRRSVFLANGVVNFNNPCFLVQPYVGFGMGTAIIKIRDASAQQISPPEPGANHYNASTSDSTSTFAGQIKLGLSFNFSECISLFAEYRWLYLSRTHYVFGSTVYPGHVETSPWQVKLKSQKYNLGNVGIRFAW